MSEYLNFKRSLPIEYLDLQKKYSELYGEKTIVLIQVGSFHEVYATKTKGYDIKALGDLLNIVVTKKDKKKPLGVTNPHMLGFPIVATNKFINILIENNFTVVKIDQVTEPPKPKRQVTGIYSPGTSIDNISKPESNNILSIYIEEVKQNANESLFIAGLSLIDLSTGKNLLYEAYSTIKDKYYALDEVNKFIIHYLPTEVIICFNSLISKSEKEIIKYIELENKLYHLIDYNSEIIKLSYQKQYLENVFTCHTKLNIFDYLDLENSIYGRISYINLLTYCQEHIKNIINNINKPSIYENDDILYIGNNALTQLDIIPNNNTKNFSLLNIIDFTYTAMGKRYLNEQLTIPIFDTELLNKRYNDIDILANTKFNTKLCNSLKEIHDTERLHRRLKLQKLQPFEILNLLNDYEQLNKVIDILTKNKYYDNFFEKDFKNNLTSLEEYYHKLFNLDKIQKITFNECSTSFYNKNIYPDIDKIQDELDEYYNLTKKIELVFSSLIEEKKKYFMEDNETEKLLVTLNYTDKEGLFLTCTNKRFTQINNKLKSNSLKITDDIIIEFSDITTKKQTNNIKIFIKQLTNLSTNIISIKDDIKVLLLKYYKDDLLKIYSQYDNLMNIIVKKISYIDFINSGSKLSLKYNYCKPIIEEADKSFVNFKNLRHPIIERITDYEYVPHSMCLGKEMNGVLLYGVNSSGKSSLMKAIGMSVILAQIGYYVPADSYTFCPYHSVITRISGNDNLFKGLSSYTLEIYEIKNILKRISKNTLVIADEVCKGTEYNSALVIVMTLLETLNKSESSFITATHLHELLKFERINNLNKIKAYHLHVEYDEINKKLIYDRILREGNGKTEYGLDVAKCIMDDDNFINLAEIIKNENNNNNQILNNKKSNYNSNLYMTNCYFCSSKNNLESHHINFQKDTDNNGFINKNKKKHIHKNHLSNLIILCELCHDKIHNNEIELKGFIETSNGKEII